MHRADGRRSKPGAFARGPRWVAGLAAASSLALIVAAVALPASPAEAAARATVSPAAVGPVASSPAAARQAAAAVTPPEAPAGSCPVYGSPGSGEIAGTDANVSVYVGGDYAATAGAAESEGILAVGENARFDKRPGGTFNVGVVGVGSQVTPPPGSDMLVAGGDVSVGDATTLDVGHGIGGNVVAGGTAAPLDRITTSGGSVASDAADPLGAFSGFGSVIAQRSASYAALPVTGTTSELYGTRTFRGDGTSSPQVFHVSGRELGSPTQAVAIRFANIPTGAPVIITVEGTAPEAYPAGFFTDAEPGQIAFGDPRFAEVATHTMWNFPDAASLTIGTGDQFLGSVLVPRATAHSTITASTNGRVLIGGDLDFSGDGNEAHSYPFPDPDFECKPEIIPPPATGRLAVQKVVVDSAGVVDPARTYAGTYSCRSAQGDPIPGSFWTVRSGGAPQIIASNLAVGSVCTLAELPPPPPDADDPSSVWQPVSITPSTVTIGTDTTSVVTVTNTVARATGSFRIQKTLSDPGSAVPPDRVFTGTSSCQLLGRDVTPADNTWSVTAGGPAAVVGPVPVGAVCEVRETLGSAPDPAAPGLGWGPTLVSPSSIVVGSGATPTVTVQNSVVPVAGSFSIVKTFSGVGSGYDPAALFDFSYSCKAPGQPAGASVDVRLAAGQQRTVSGVAAGSTCAVTEGVEPPTSDPSYEWQDPEVSVSDPAATVSGRTATFTVAPGTSPAVQVSFVDTLLRQTGDFAVQKVTIDPRRVVDPTRAFTGDWNCEYAGSQVAGGRWTVRANEGAALLATQLPLGTTCVANEDLQISPPDPAEPRFTWAASSSTRSSTPVAPGAVAVVTLTNVVTERLAAATIVKVVDDTAGTAPAGARYSGTVVCSPPGGGPALTAPWSIEAGRAPSLLIDGVAEGSSCVVHENPAPAPGAGSQWSPPVISPESFVAYQADPVTVTVRNIIVPSGTVDPGGVGPGGGGPVDPGGIAPAVTPPQLAFTGSAPTPLGLAGLAALLAGWLVVFASRRRRR